MYKVCFADDEPIVFKVLNALVDWTENGYQIAGTATDGIEALALYEREKPDFFIIDIKMPLLDGLSCVKHIRERDNKIKIVLLTASDSFESAQEALNLGANGYLLKPVSRESINKIVSKITAELSQAPGRSNDSDQNSDAFILQKELQHLYAAALNPDSDFAWFHQSNLVRGNYRLLDITLHSGSQQNPGSISSFLEQLSIYLTSLGIVLPAHYITAGTRAIYAAAASEEKLFSSIEMYLSKFSDKLQYSIYISGCISEENICSNLFGSMRANKIHSFYYSENWIGNFISKAAAEACSFPFNEIKPIIASAVQELSIDSVASFLQNIFLTAKAELYSPRQLQGFCYNILIQLKIHMRELGLPQFADELDNVGIESFLTTENSAELYNHTISIINQQLESLAGREDFSRNAFIVRKANAYAMENYADPHLSLESAAEHVGLSKNYFIRLYGKETGMSYWTYITELRIERAKLLLSSTQLSMSDICEQIGYDDVSYFSRRFKLETGMSPRKYRHDNTQNGSL